MSTVQIEPQALAEYLDKQAIAELVRLERFWRDSGNWEKLAACYTEDSRVKTTWFEGTGQEFTDASQLMAERGRQGTHPITPVRIQVNGDRALVESMAEIHTRWTIDGVELNLVMECRFFSRVRRTPDGWRLVTFDGIYHYDTITPVNPADTLPVDWVELRGLRPSYRSLAWALGKSGYPVGPDELGDDRPDLLEPFYRAAEDWLETRE